MLKPIDWQYPNLKLLDQRALPHKTVWQTLTNPTEVAAAITDMVVRGAPAIGIAAAYGLCLLGKRVVDDQVWQKAYKVLANSRPTAVNLHHALQRMAACRAAACQQTTDANAIATILFNEAIAIEREDLAANQAIGRFGSSTIEGTNLCILTHCNTGALATAGWGTALGVIRQLWQEGRLREVLITETRPYWQGARLTAWELMQDGIAFRLIPDGAAAAALKTQNVSAVVVGADRISADGSVANKIGTYSIALAAQYHQVPFYVAAPRSTVDLSLTAGSDIVIEERPAHELTHVSGQAIAPLGIKAWNPAFDVTPARLIRGIFLETGTVLPVNANTLYEKISARSIIS